ncbi:succinyl-diaminopimelate desuccinylase [Sphingomonas morindae]|uniref:Succinyl-diaminopimelate desuccinylase n=1 Tax=Sphingomonas morindae TaxID=1541170 RepID=A0ABY4XAP8_9SPHN|nr:succinyl-diaminopimelate desuccinylase [Sphingomonas morindae]USI73950.1 succinyl-diaminopimelate desuccinylase [Sphingomonas morindae]
MTALDPVRLAAELIACPSVTPEEGGAQQLLAQWLSAQGFAVERFAAGAAPHGPVPNLIAVRHQGDGPHFAFAGHSDVVPPGEGWTDPPFAATRRGDLLYGRGAVDMKGALAAFVAAADRVREHRGTISLLITGDEEGPAVHGTRAIMTRLAERGLRPDMILVGEPTSSSRLGDMMKIGRRGSINAWVRVPGTQGHVAYPHLADNPVARLVRILARLQTWEIDRGTDWFQPSNLEVTELVVGNPATNIIPGAAAARLNIRFNTLQSGADLAEAIRRIALEEAPRAEVEAMISGEAFLTAPGPLSALVADAVTAVTGLVPELSTSGGTSDARFLSALAPTVEFGLTNATMHKLDEAVAVADLHALTAIYAELLRRALA